MAHQGFHTHLVVIQDHHVNKTPEPKINEMQI